MQASSLLGRLSAAGAQGGDPTVTHDVSNTVPPLADYDVSADDALREALHREGAGWFAERLGALGVRAGSRRALVLGDEANRDLPRLRTHDGRGRRIDEVEFAPAWHELLGVAVAEGLSGALTWRVDGSAAPAGSHAARTAGFYVWSQAEAGHMCPVSMSYAAVPVLRANPELTGWVLPALLSGRYEPGLAPLQEKAGALVGMGMTEKQGGSDVRANTTSARLVDEALGGIYLLRGHKWFTSAPMSDGFLMLGRAPEGLSCFFVPRVLPDGSRNRLHLARLKDKCGNRSNASSELELADALAVLVGEPGRGVRTIIDMVALTRLDCVAGSAALQRVALVQALWHARHRSAFGRRLWEAPLMRAVLADLALESEAATTLALRLAGAVDRGARGDEAERAFARIATAVAKYWVCKRTPAAVAEALECLGGNGFVEESRMPRHYREAPLNSIWEGAGNVNALDVLRAAQREPAALEALRAELAAGAGRDPDYDARLAGWESTLRGGGGGEAGARRLAEEAALLLQAGLLLRYAPPPVATGFCRARLSAQAGLAFGALPPGVDAGAVIARASAGLPAVG